ncbi:hypothetical protein Mucpa_0394 [Mucilaginibacter paludis DSM 18603]|uniref:Uncharacterized protein n=1 Tax=Mucilaginibacter paludis DSM 18603 TaxID=714943 RepID=H1YH87_9SPHI|nr:hypothetical protein Mucpa_0394 [Mucilaginibacter paludis DSM 18603]
MDGWMDGWMDGLRDGWSELLIGPLKTMSSQPEGGNSCARTVFAWFCTCNKANQGVQTPTSTFPEEGIVQGRRFELSE